MINKEIIRAYALKNAVEHEGKAIVGSVINALFNYGLKKENVKGIIPEINEILKEVNSMSPEEQKKHLSERENLIGHRPEREGLPELPSAKKGKVIMRMSPSPSGGLTLGNLLTIAPNFLYVQKYGGIFYIRIEDTNPDKVYKPAYKLIKEECKWFCKDKVKFVIQSERMNLYYKYVKKLIDKNSAYVCECDSEKFRELLIAKKACPCRGLEKKEHLQRWKKMLDKNGKTNYKEGQAVVRFKSDLNNPNPAFRDFPLARINETTHPMQKKKYRVWPLMNLAVPVDDIEMKMTHMIRGKDHKDNEPKQRMIFKVLGKEYPWTAYIGRIHFKDLEMSKSAIRKGIDEGKYNDWDDKRLPTAASLKRRGYKPEAFWKFAEQRGLSEVDKIISKEDFFVVLDNFQKEVE
ncbi:MAG: glutamate--tRNA ligase family protein [Candidatus Nanoarchaeia archaeon]|nr:glutamate--tRNA ligase family protein [Candidatus Nanoarchaeia archaeon]MDD5741648.1 glutamate--tRNA ligase family protein [Candidatus Nanoarchaeia archaeon]